MTPLRTAAQQALEALESAEVDPHSSDAVYKAITALKAALAEPQSTHSTECYQWHHKCAVAEVQRLRAEMEEIDSDGWRCGVYKMPDLPLAEPVQEPAWCEIHQHHKWCEHNGGVMGPTGWEKP